jgi:hypothetical protein
VLVILSQPFGFAQRRLHRGVGGVGRSGEGQGSLVAGMSAGRSLLQEIAILVTHGRRDIGAPSVISDDSHRMFGRRVTTFQRFALDYRRMVTINRHLVTTFQRFALDYRRFRRSTVAW